MTDRDDTEGVRRFLVKAINAEPGSREDLESIHGQVWDTQEMQRDFTVESFAAPFVFVVRKADNVRGLLAFQHLPRFYFDFSPAI